MRIVQCPKCPSKIRTKNNRAKYCSDKCRLLGKRDSWNKFAQSHRKEKRDYHKNWYEKNKDRRTAQIKKYQSSPAGKKATQINGQRMRAKYPEKKQAREEVLKALRKGILTKKPCEVCSNPKSEAHHKDYSKPLEVEWLCRPHHKIADKKLKNELPKTA